jgi:hypothetical protein
MSAVSRKNSRGKAALISCNYFCPAFKKALLWLVDIPKFVYQLRWPFAHFLVLPALV